MLERRLIPDVVFCLVIVVMVFLSNIYSFDCYPLVVSITSLYLVVIAYAKHGFFSFSFLFSVSFVLFNSSRYALDLFGFIDVKDIVYFADYSVSTLTYEIQSTLLLLFLFTILFFVDFEKSTINRFRFLKVNKCQKFIVVSLFLLSLVSQIYKVNHLLINSGDLDYISFQKNYSELISSVPSLIRYLSYFISISFVLVVISIELNKRTYKLISLTYMSVLAYTTSLGGRAIFFTSLLLVVWLYGRLYNKKSVSFKSLIVISSIVLLILVFGQVLVSLRMGGDATIDIVMMIPLILYDQGTTITVFSLVQKNIHIVSEFSVMMDHVLRYFYMPFSGLLRYFGFEFKQFSFVEVVARYIDPTGFEEGYGLGGSIMAELYLYFKWFSFLIFYLILKLYKKISECDAKSYFFVLVPIAMQGIFFSPRSYAFEFVIEVGRGFVYVVFVVLFLWVVRHVTTFNRPCNI